MRIAAKRLRYTLEIFEDALPSACQSIAHELAQVQQALVKAGKQKGKGKLLLQPALVASVLDADVAPSAEQRYGLERLLHKQVQLREEHYRVFRQHWYQLKARDFRRELQDVLN